MSKTGSAVIRLRIGAGKATPSPPIGPALGQRGVKAIDFCKQFNDRTKHIISGTPIPTIINVNKDRTFNFITKTPETSFLVKQAAGIEKGASEPGKSGQVATVSLKHVYEIARIKQTDGHMAQKELKSLVKSVIGTARSMGVTVVP
jgi:large subunit ribosomal protein L11